MKVFISWSGGRSKAVAEVLNDWVKCVLQAAKPWISTQDIDRGTVWFNQIQTQLQDTSIGIVCLTQENKLKPWILFEAGALAKGLSASRVCTFLIDLSPGDIESPLAQFNHTFPNRDGLWQLIVTLNACLDSDKQLTASILEKVFDTYWPQFEKGFAAALETTNDAPPEPTLPDSEVLSEILKATRALGSRMGRIEQRVAKFAEAPSALKGLKDAATVQPSASELLEALRRYSPADKKAESDAAAIRLSDLLKFGAGNSKSDDDSLDSDLSFR